MKVNVSITSHSRAKPQSIADNIVRNVRERLRDRAWRRTADEATTGATSEISAPDSGGPAFR